MSSDSEAELEVNNLEDETIVNKYKMAADIVQRILKELITKCQPGANLLELCTYGDQRINEEAAKIFKKEKEMKKGCAYPTSISKNNIVANFCPEQSNETFENGDLVKIDLGCYIDGYAAVVGHTFVIGASKENKITGRKADVILAAHNCVEAALRLIKPGKDSKGVSEPLIHVAGDYNCKVLENCMANGMEKNIFENDKTFMINPSDDLKKSEKVDFDINQVWTIDVVVTTGDAKVKERDVKSTVYRRVIADKKYQLKLKASRQIYSDVCNKFLNYPFTLRSFPDTTKAKIGVLECAKHGLMESFPIMYEKDGEFVAHFKYTVLLMANGPMKLTGLAFDQSIYQSTLKIQNPTVKTLLSEPIKNKKKVAETN